MAIRPRAAAEERDSPSVPEIPGLTIGLFRVSAGTDPPSLMQLEFRLVSHCLNCPGVAHAACLLGERRGGGDLASPFQEVAGNFYFIA